MLRSYDISCGVVQLLLNTITCGNLNQDETSYAINAKTCCKGMVSTCGQGWELNINLWSTGNFKAHLMFCVSLYF